MRLYICLCFSFTVSREHAPVTRCAAAVLASPTTGAPVASDPFHVLTCLFSSVSSTVPLAVASERVCVRVFQRRSEPFLLSNPFGECSFNFFTLLSRARHLVTFDSCAPAQNDAVPPQPSWTECTDEGSAPRTLDPSARDWDEPSAQPAPEAEGNRVGAERECLHRLVASPPPQRVGCGASPRVDPRSVQRVRLRQ